MQGLLEQALTDPWGAMDLVLDGPLHPGGTESTEALLDRADVGAETRLVDAGCGAGQSLELARERGADVVGLDHDPPAGGIRGDLSELPLRAHSVDVFLAECVMCLVPDRMQAFAEARRVLTADGRLALSDVVVEGEIPPVPEPLAEPLCLSNSASTAELVEDIEAAGFAVDSVRDHRDGMLAMRDELQESVDYEALFRAMGEEEMLEAVTELETAVEDGRLGYVSLVATAV